MEAFEKYSTHIITDRLSLQLITQEDTEAIFSYAKDPEVALNTSWYAHKTIADSQAFVAYVLRKNSFESGRIRHVWGIKEKGETKTIGTISFVQDNEKEGHIDYALSKQYWGKGYTTEAVKALIKWIFNTVNSLEVIHSGCLSRNIGSIRVLEKAGFELVEEKFIQRGEKFENKVLASSYFRIFKNNT